MTETSVTEGYIQSSDGVELYYQTRGVGSDSLIMLHGGPGADSGYLAPDLEPLEETCTATLHSLLAATPAEHHGMDGSFYRC